MSCIPGPWKGAAALATCAVVCVGGCAPTARVGDGGEVDAGEEGDLARGDLASPIDMTFVPTGSISTPPVCRREGGEVQVTYSSLGTTTFSLAWDTDHYLVVFSDDTTGAGDLQTLRLDPAGMALSPSIFVEASAAESRLPSLVRSATGWVVVWEEGLSPIGIRAHRLDDDGQPTGSGVTLATSAALEARPVVTRAPGGVAVAWTDEVATIGLVRAVLLDGGLSLLAGGPTTLTDPLLDSRFPWLAGTDVSLSLAWAEPGTVSGQGNILFGRLGTALEWLGSPSALRMGAGEARLPRLLGASYGFLAAWEDTRTGENEVWASLMDTTGTSFFSGLVEEPGTGDANWPHLASEGSSAAISYYQFRAGNPQVFVSFIDNRGQRVGGGADLQVSETTSWARFPQIVWAGSEYGVAWVDTRTGIPQLYFARVICP